MRCKITTCIDCGRATIQARVYRKFPAVHKRFARRASHGMCVGCERYARIRGTYPRPAKHLRVRGYRPRTGVGEPQGPRLSGAEVARLRALVGVTK